MTGAPPAEPLGHRLPLRDHQRWWRRRRRRRRDRRDRAEQRRPRQWLSGATGAQSFFSLDVPSGATNLKFTIAGGSGDADLYVKFGSKPSLTSYDCRPYVTGNNETCNISNIQAGTYYVMLNGYATYSGVTLTGSFSTGSTPPPPPPTGNVLSNGVPVTGISGAKGSKTYYTMDVPSGASSLSFSISGGSGDADLYVKFGSDPTLSSYDCRPYITGNNETCTISNIQTGTYHVMLHGYAAYSGVSLTGSFSTGSTPPPPPPTGNVLTNGVPVTVVRGDQLQHLLHHGRAGWGSSLTSASPVAPATPTSTSGSAPTRPCPPSTAARTSTATTRPAPSATCRRAPTT